MAVVDTVCALGSGLTGRDELAVVVLHLDGGLVLVAE